MRKFLTDPITYIVAAIIALLALAFWGISKESEQWKKFQLDHNCKVVSHISGSVFNTIGFSSGGQMAVGIGSTPDKTGWLCDDGVTYYR